ncbi:MAG: hypothetical protein ACM3L6_04415 [Deltaproteobacteria bacterium]
MSERGFEVRKVWRQVLSIWGRHIVVFAALSSISYFLLSLLREARKVVAAAAPGAPAGMVAAVLLGLLFVWVAGQGLVILLILGHYRRLSSAERPVFQASWSEACRGWARYVVNVLVLLGLGLFFLALSAILLEAGLRRYVAHQENLTPLIATHLAAVIFVIGMAWYGFYFSLAPLVGAYEGSWPAAAFRESRRRIRGRALGYLAALALFIVGYMAAGLALYYGLIALRAGAGVLAWVDPAMLILFSPLWAILWYASYEHLTQLKKESSAAKL